MFALTFGSALYHVTPHGNEHKSVKYEDLIFVFYTGRKALVLQRILESEKRTQYQLFPFTQATFGHDLPAFRDFPLAAENKIPGFIVFDV